jgi:4-hydroxyacetophenone monooxygenase
MAIDTDDDRSRALLVSDDFLRRAIDQSHLNALRVALYQQTGDPEFAAMKVETHAPAGTPFLAHVVVREHHDRLKEKAFEFLRAYRGGAAPRPDRARALELMALFQGDTVDAVDTGAADYGLEELAFDDFSRQASWRTGVRPGRLDGFIVTIVGAGFSGIAAGIQLDRLGIPFRIIERQSGIGGTWELNDYPEARVDITTFLYQYKFVKNYPWKSYFATRDELKDYIDHVVDTYGIRDRIETRTTLRNASWHADDKKWMLDIEHADGSIELFASNVVISAAGLFSTPNLPDIPGIGDFEGTIFHTTAWDHGHDFTGERVALIGTGSTGSQLMPALARRAARLDVYQRTPNWVTPVRGYHDRVTPEKRWLLDNMPYYSNWFSYSHHLAQMQSQNLHRIDPAWTAKGGHINEKNDQLRAGLTRYIRRKLGDRTDLIDKLTPSYAPMARRLVVDNGWYDTLVRDNVELVTDGIDHFTASGIVTRSGRRADYDLVVLGAGFRVSQYLWPVDYVGRDGARLEDLWSADGARAYLTVALPGFPNFFMLYGPNAGVRSGSFHSWMEILTRYICGCIVAMLEGDGDVIEVRREAYDAYNKALDAQMQEMLWESEKGGGGYYVNEFGRSGVNMPWTLAEFYARVREPDLDDFIVS